MYQSFSQVLAEMMKSHSTSVTMPSFLTFLCYFPLLGSIKLTGNIHSMNADHTSQMPDK